MISDSFVSIMNLKRRECFYLQFTIYLQVFFSIDSMDLCPWRGGREVTKRFIVNDLNPGVSVVRIV